MKRILQFAAFAAILAILVLLTPSCDGGAAGGASGDVAALVGDPTETGDGSSSGDASENGDSVLSPGDAPPAIDPLTFSMQVDNPYFPLDPGTTLTYEGDTDEGRVRVEVIVTDVTREVMGVSCRVVETAEHIDGRLVEETAGFYAQDAEGTVWLFGEETSEYEAGRPIATDASWEAGAGGAQPNVVMPADPRPGDTWRGEYSPGGTEDRAEVLAREAAIALAGGLSVSCVLVREWDRLEAETDEYKYYAPGVGHVRSADPDGANAVDLVDVSRR